MQWLPLDYATLRPSFQVPGCPRADLWVPRGAHPKKDPWSGCFDCRVVSYGLWVLACWEEAGFWTQLSQDAPRSRDGPIQVLKKHGNHYSSIYLGSDHAVFLRFASVQLSWMVRGACKTP